MAKTVKIKLERGENRSEIQQKKCPIIECYRTLFFSRDYRRFWTGLAFIFVRISEVPLLEKKQKALNEWTSSQQDQSQAGSGIRICGNHLSVNQALTDQIEWGHPLKGQSRKKGGFF